MIENIATTTKIDWRIFLGSLNEIVISSQKKEKLESALTKFSSLALATLGDQNAHKKPGNLKSGEHQFSVAGFFMHMPKEEKSVLIAEKGFPVEQHRLSIPDSLGHPGWVVKNKKPLLLSNTDEHSDFKQILKTARMGSAMYSPLFRKGSFIGQFITASQARNTYNSDDHVLHQTMTSCASAIFCRFGETEVLNTINN